MKKSEAQQLIRSEYINWKNNPELFTSHEPQFSFFVWLQQNKPELLNFRYVGSDKWQAVFVMLIGL